MNEYLEKLVRIEEAIEESVSEAIEEEIELPEAVEQAVDIEDPTEIEETPIDEEGSDSSDETEEPESSEGSKGAEDDNENNVKLTAPDPTQYEIGQEIDVKDIRIYNSPDIHQVSKLYSGKVIYTGQIDRFSVVKYMKHGFGLVQGYTKDLI